ncbi:14-3-3 domain-containing protein, partial [Neohortaea acidophila]
MAVSQIEEKILGRLAKDSLPLNEGLATSLYQVLGLSIMLSKKLLKARRYRRLDTNRNTKSLQLYHHIIWLTREGLLITEQNILPYCQSGQYGGECRVMAAKLRASFYHVLCLFHNHPSSSPLSSRAYDTGGSPSSVLAPKADNGQNRPSGKKRQNDGTESEEGPRRKGKAPLRDPVLSMTSDASYVTNPYTGTQGQTPPPTMPPPPIPTEARRTPALPPGLNPISIPANAASASFLLPALDYVPIAKEYFNAAQYLATNLLFPANPLRLSLSLEHAAFLQDCSDEPDRARRLARAAIKDVYASSEGLDDEEFADASTLVQLLGGVVRRNS